MSKLKFTIIGLGHIGNRHAAIIAALPDSELEIGMRYELGGMSEEVRMKSDKLPADTKLFTNNSSLLPLNSIAAICTPNNLHCAQAIEAMKNGNDVIIEKPMGLTVAECREVISVAKSLDRKVFCVMQNRFSPPSKWLKELIGSGRLGKIYSVQVNCFWNRNKAYYEQSTWKGKLVQDGGTLYTQFSHFIDTLFWLFGDIEPVSAQFYNHNHPYIEFEDSGVVNARGENRETRGKSEEVRSKSAINSSLLPLTSESTHNSFPIQINYSTSAYAQNLESSITILAENGTVKVGGQYMEKILACNVKEYEMPILEETQPPNDYGHYKGSASNHAYVYQNVLDVLAGKADIACTAEEGLKVVEFIEKVYTWRMGF
jgi:UDP-N-acetyl-2-amino-2-deoxyglucuronate dehydrogenase